MNIKIPVLMILLFACALQATAQNNFPYENYKTRTLSEILEISADLQKKPNEKLPVPDTIFSGDFLHSQVRVKFMSKSRPISTERKELLGSWQKSFSVDARTIALFTNEYLFMECGTEYWILVQGPVAAFFPKELKEGDMVSLYLTRAAGRKTKDGYDWILLVNEFDK